MKRTLPDLTLDVSTLPESYVYFVYFINQEAEAAAAAEVAFVIQGVQRRGLEFAIPVGLAPPLGPPMSPLQEPVQ